MSMKTSLALVAASLLAALVIPGPVLGQEGAGGGFGEAPKIFRQNCAKCHFVPDLSIDRDKTWIGLIQTTS